MAIAGRRVVVTGASSGLGAAHRPPPRGPRRPRPRRRPPACDRLEALAAELEGGPGRVVPFRADVTVDADARAMVAAAVEAFGGIDVLVNNAGSEVQGADRRLADADFEGMLRANVVSVFLVHPGGAAGAPRGAAGAVINLGSTVVARPPRGRFGYVASKGAVEAMSRALAARPRARRHPGQRASGPGSSRPSCAGSTEEAERARFETGIAFGRQALSAVGDGRDIAEAVAWLAGDGGRWVTGAVIDVDGGFTLGAADVL